MPVRQLIEALNARLRGHYNFYGVVGNYGSLCSFFNQTKRLLRNAAGESLKGYTSPASDEAVQCKH